MLVGGSQRVEVSTDGGTTWQPAAGRDEWQYTLTTDTTPDSTVTIQARAIDDSLNIGDPGVAVTLTVGAARTCETEPCSIFAPSRHWQ